ncbi:MAG: hypothetical protein GVY26_15285 [Bacteroidetes bacterium]|jgi:hypothetical protein|nr:hypothetical protein [Bacteroidota bacterium]
MKNLILTTIGLMIALLAYSQDDAYTKAMTHAVSQLKTAEQSRAFEASASAFERISAAAPEEWLPSYYEAYCQIMLASQAMEQEQTDRIAAHLDKAQAAVDRAKALAPQSSEVAALQGYIYTGRIWESPMVNGARYSSSSRESYNKAIELDPENPRGYHLMGMHIFFTPKFFGGGAEKALPYLRKAAERFERHEPASELHPSWGDYFNKELLKRAEKAVN